MIEPTLFLGIAIYFIIWSFWGSEIYYWGLKFFGDRKLKELGISINDLEFSFEQIDYLVSTPSANNNLDLDSLYIKQIKDSIFWPQIYALQINSKTGLSQEKKLAIIAKDRFPVPMLDMLIYKGQINQSEYNLLVSYLFSHPKTHKLILEEVKAKVSQR